MTSISNLDLALISAHVYRKNDRVGGDSDIQGWNRVTESELANALLGTTGPQNTIPFSDQWGDGFYADAYRNSSDKWGQYIFSRMDGAALASILNQLIDRSSGM